MSLREVRSPLTPKMTMAAGAMTRSTPEERRGLRASWARVQASTGCDQTSEGTGSVRSVDSRTPLRALSSGVASVVVTGVSVIERSRPHRACCIGNGFPFEGYWLRRIVGDGLQGDRLRRVLLAMRSRVGSTHGVSSV